MRSEISADDAMGERVSPIDVRVAIRRQGLDDASALSLLGDDVDLIDSGGRTPIFHAVISERDSLVQKLLASGASPAHQDSDGRSPLHFAIQSRSVPVARLLLEAGAPVDARDAHGNTALWGAVMQFRDFEEMIKLLLAFGANADSKNAYDKSPRDLAQSLKVGDAAEWLVRHAKNGNAQS